MRCSSLFVFAIIGASICAHAKRSPLALSSRAQSSYADWVQEQNVPPEIRDGLKHKDFARQYTISFRLNPFYLRGDFNGDGLPDVAVLIIDKTSSKTGIMIVHGRTDQVFIVGAGTPFRSRDDDLQWMNVWQVRPKGTLDRSVFEGRAPPAITGETIYAEKSEAASGLIYWTGRQYRWYQLGD